MIPIDDYPDMLTGEPGPAGGEKKGYPNILQALGLLLLVILLQLALTAVTQSVAFLKKDIVLATGLVNLLSLGAVTLIGFSRNGRSLRETFPLRPVPASMLGLMILTLCGLTILVSEMDNLLRLVMPPPPAFNKLMTDIVGGSVSLWSTLFTVVIIAPLTEEPFFRGLLMRGFLDNYGPGKAILVSALLFGLLHLNPWQFVGAVILGLVFGWWYVRTASLWPCLIGHAVNNAIPVVLIGLLKWSIPGYTESYSATVRLHPLWLDAVGLAVVGLGIWTLRRVFNEYDGK